MSTAYNRCRRKPPLNRGRDNDGGGLGLGALPPAQVFSLRPLRNFFAIFAVKLFPETHLTAKFAEEGRQRSRSEMLRFDAGFCPRPVPPALFGPPLAERTRRLAQNRCARLPSLVGF